MWLNFTARVPRRGHREAIFQRCHNAKTMKHHLLRRWTTSARWLAAFTLGAGALPLLAQNGEPFRITTGVGYRADADIDNNGGDFSETRFSVSGSRGFNPNEKLRIEPMVAYRFSAYDFSRPEPWDDIHSIRATVLARYVIDDKWAVLGGPSIGFSGESDADASDAMTFGGALGASYRVSETLVVGAGFTASTEIEDDARIRPLVILNWQINDRWSFESGYMEVAAGGGPGGEIRYKINDAWSVSGGMQYQEKRFRLSDDAPVREGVGEDSSLPLYARVTWQAFPNAAFELVGGVSVGGELRLDNRDGHTIAEEDYDPAPLVGLRAILTF
jgi:hypothetical protein